MPRVPDGTPGKSNRCIASVRDHIGEFACAKFSSCGRDTRGLLGGKMFSEIFEGLFGKKKKYHELKKENHYQVESENLAVPEVHVDHGDAAPEKEKEEAGHAETGEDESITYDNVAIPEIHVHHKKK